jgi:ribokinase
MNFKDPYVLVIGSSNMDLNMYSKRFPTPGETITGGKFSQSFGGKGANQAVAAIRSGSKTVFIGKIGIDPFGTQMLENLTKEGIDTQFVIKDPEEASGVAMILIDPEGQNMISVAPGANKNWTSDDLDDAVSLVEYASVVLFQMEISSEIISKIAHIITENEAISILNPAPFKEIPLKTLKNIDILTPNENELFKLYSYLGFTYNSHDFLENLPEIVNDLHIHGINSLVVTLGSKGCYVSDKNTKEQLRIHGIEVDSTDAVGAGDCFNGVLASRICKGDSLINAAKYANVAASIAVTRKGAQTSMPIWKEIKQKFSEICE